MAAAASSAPYRTVPRVLLMQKRALTGGKARTNSDRQSMCTLRLWRCCSALAWSHMPGRRTPHRAARSGGPCPCTCTNRLRSTRLACLSARQSARMAHDGRLQHAPARAWWHARTQQQHQARGADVPVLSGHVIVQIGWVVQILYQAASRRGVQMTTKRTPTRAKTAWATTSTALL